MIGYITAGGPSVRPSVTSQPASTVFNSSLFTPALLRTHSFVFFAYRYDRIIVSVRGRVNRTATCNADTLIITRNAAELG